MILDMVDANFTTLASDLTSNYSLSKRPTGSFTPTEIML